jgi:hypothetical protein
MSKSKSELKELEERFRKESSDIDLAVALAQSHLDAGNSSRAKEVLDKVIKENDSAGAALALRAEVMAERHDWVGAERDCRLARKAGYPVSWNLYLKSAYFRWLALAAEGWRPEFASRMVTLVMCAATGLLLVSMGVRLLFQGAYLGFALSFVMGLGFFWGGMAVGGGSMWLKQLQDRLTPGWDQSQSTKKKSSR